MTTNKPTTQYLLYAKEKVFESKNILNAKSYGMHSYLETLIAQKFQI